MKKLFCIIILHLIFYNTQAQQGNELKALSAEQLTNTVSQYSVPVLVHLKADWCVVCKKESPQLQQFQKLHANDIVVLEIDLDLNPKLGEHFEIDALPVHLLYYKSDLVWNKIGKLDFNQLEEILAVLKEKAQKSKR